LRHKVDFPILIAPTAMQKMAHHDGELATARASKSMGTIITLSSLSTTRADIVAKEAGLCWFQLYIMKDREVTKNLLRMVENSGYTAICLTVDTPFLGKREEDVRNGFHLPDGLFLENFKDIPESSLSQGLSAYISSLIDSSLNWNDIEWLKSQTKLPILLKGILSPEDALLAIKHKVDGIIVSNHGARQLDTSPATIDVLPLINDVVRGRIPIILDGGIRRGTDVLKAISLGASAVMIGRPILWGLTHAGEEGVRDVLQLLKNEFKLAMALCGCSRVSDINKSLIFNKSSKL